MTGSLRTIILNLRDDIGTLTKSVQDKKDEEMARMMQMQDELKETNKNLVTNERICMKK